MGEKNSSENIYSRWYNISNEFGKQLFDMSNIGNLNYDALQESWQGYSKRMGEQISDLMKVDENSYKDIMTLWNEFTDNMSTQISNLTIYEKDNYSKWYEDWLDNSDRFNKEITDIIQKQLKYQSEIYETNELWLNRFGIKEEQKQQILDMSQIIAEYWLEAVNKTTEIVKESLNPESKTDFIFKFQEFYDYLTYAYSNMIKRLITTSGMEELKDFKFDPNLLNYNKVQELFIKHLKSYGLPSPFNASSKDFKSEITELKERLETLTDELDNLKRSQSQTQPQTQKQTSKKSRSRKKR
jgi:hypothetical protein